MLSAGQRISTPQHIHACLGCNLQVADLSISYLLMGCRNKFGMTLIFE